MYILGCSHKIVHQIIYIYIYSVKYFRENSRIFSFTLEYPEERRIFSYIYWNAQINTKIQTKTNWISLYFCKNPRNFVVPEENRVFHSIFTATMTGKQKSTPQRCRPPIFKVWLLFFYFPEIYPAASRTRYPKVYASRSFLIFHKKFVIIFIESKGNKNFSDTLLSHK